MRREDGEGQGGRPGAGEGLTGTGPAGRHDGLTQPPSPGGGQIGPIPRKGNRLRGGLGGQGHAAEELLSLPELKPLPAGPAVTTGALWDPRKQSAVSPHNQPRSPEHGDTSSPEMLRLRVPSVGVGRDRGVPHAPAHPGRVALGQLPQEQRSPAPGGPLGTPSHKQLCLTEMVWVPETPREGFSQPAGPSP